jgi:hypothetical protein
MGDTSASNGAVLKDRLAPAFACEAQVSLPELGSRAGSAGDPRSWRRATRDGAAGQLDDYRHTFGHPSAPTTQGRLASGSPATPANDRRCEEVQFSSPRP